MKKTFPCGHKGKGQYCHTCRALELADAKRQQEKQERKEKISVPGIELSGFPPYVAGKAADIIRQLRSGKAYTDFKGKRLVNRTMISVPLGYSYRILCRDEGGVVVPLEVLSHEDYNRRVRDAMSGVLKERKC